MWQLEAEFTHHWLVCTSVSEQLCGWGGGGAGGPETGWVGWEELNPSTPKWTEPLA